MKTETKVILAGVIGAIAGGIAVANHYEKDKYKSTIKVDEYGEVEDIHLWGSKTTKSFIKKKLPEEMTSARLLWEQHEHLKSGFTMIIQ